MKNTADLVQSAQKGNVAAYARIYREYKDMAVAYAYSLLGDFHDAEDAAQDAFVAAYQRIGQVRDPSRFAAWLRRVVFTYADRLKRKRRSAISLDIEIEDKSKIADPAISAEFRETQIRVLDALISMPEKQRQAVLMCYVCGYSSIEIGAFLDVPPSTIRSRLASSRRWVEKDALYSIRKANLHSISGYDRITLQIEKLMETDVETINGKSFSVRDTRYADAFDMHEYWSDPESCRYNNPPMSLEEIQTSLNRQLENPKFRLLAVVHKGKVIGDIAIFEDPERGDYRHIDFLFNKKIGFASNTMASAIRLICRTLFETENVARINKHAIDKNTDEIEILEQIGFSFQENLKTVSIDNEVCTVARYSLSAESNRT